MRLTDITAIGRLPDPRYPTNLAIILVGLAVGAVGAATRWLTGDGWLAALQWGAGAGLALFFAWALARELDPDHDLSAFVGAGLALLGLFAFDLPGLMGLLWAMLLLRVVNRSPGPPATVLDSLGVLALAGSLAWQGHWMLAGWTALAFALDGWLPSPNRRQLLFAGLALLIGGLALALGRSLPAEGPGPWLLWVAALGTAALFLRVALGPRTVRSVGDWTGEPLHLRRVQAAQGLGLLIGLQALWSGGLDGLAGWLPLWVALLGVALYGWALPVAQALGSRSH